MSGQFNIGEVSPTKYFFVAAAGLGLLFSLVSMDDNENIVVNLLQWQLQTAFSIGLLIAVHALLYRVGLRVVSNPWVQLIISGVVGASLFAPIALLIEGLMGTEDELVNLKAALLHEWLAVTPPVVASWLLLNAPWLIGFRLSKTNNLTRPASPGVDRSSNSKTTIDKIDSVTGVLQDASLPNESTANLSCKNRVDQVDIQPAPQAFEQQDQGHFKNAGEPAFFRLLPSNAKGELIYLKAELHYLLVVTDSAEALILYNLKDAVEELADYEGQLIHRSYWVAKRAVVKCGRKNREGWVELSNAARLPVSRTYISALKDLSNH